MYSVEGGSGKSFIYDPVEKTIEVFRPDGSHDIIKKDNESYGITYQAMEADTGYDFSKAEPDWELENRRAYWDAKEELDAQKDKEVDDIMAKIDELYLKSQEKEKTAEAKTTAQNRGIYAGYMQEIDPYGEYAERIAKKGLTKSGYPQYDYEGFKQAFEAQAGDNMQNLRQLKAEIRAALQLAIATENEKLEEALLNYRTNLTKLEQEYLGQSRMGDETVRAEEVRAEEVAPLSASSEQEGFETAGSDIAEKRNGIISFAKALPNTDMRPWQEEIRNLDELPDVGKAANLLYRRADDDSDDALFEASLKPGDNSLYSLNDDMMDWLAEEYGIETGSNARTVLEALGYRVTVGVDRLIIQGNGLSFEIYKGTDAGFEVDRYKNLKFAGNWRDNAIMKQILNPEKTAAVQEDFLDFAERIQAGEELTLAEMEQLYQNYEWVQGIKAVEDALRPLYNNDEFVSLLEQCVDSFDLDIDMPLSGEEVLLCVLTSMITGVVIETKNDKFNSFLKLFNLGLLISPVGVGRKVLVDVAVKSIAKKLIPKILNKAAKNWKTKIDDFLTSDKFKQLQKADLFLDVVGYICDIVEEAYYTNNQEIPPAIKNIIDALKML